MGKMKEEWAKQFEDEGYPQEVDTPLALGKSTILRVLPWIATAAGGVGAIVIACLLPQQNHVMGYTALFGCGIFFAGGLGWIARGWFVDVE